MMKESKNGSSKLKLLLLICVLAMSFNQAKAQFYSLKTDAVGWATGTFNLEAGMTLSYQWSLHVPVYYNPWTFTDNKKIKNISFLPGVRFWLKETYGSGFFFGGNAVISRFNFGGIFGNKFRYDGVAFGGGLSAGYSIPIHKQWNLDFELGGAVVWSRWDKYPCVRCGARLKEDSGVRLIPDKLAVSIIYLF